MRFTKNQLSGNPLGYQIQLGKIPKDPKEIKQVSVKNGIILYMVRDKIVAIYFDGMQGWNKDNATQWLNENSDRTMKIANPKVKSGTVKRKFLTKDIEDTEEGKYLRARIRNPKDFTNMFTIPFNVERGVQAIIGVPQGHDTSKVQAILFCKERWNKSEAVEWLNKHSDTF